MDLDCKERDENSEDFAQMRRRDICSLIKGLMIRVLCREALASPQSSVRMSHRCVTPRSSAARMWPSMRWYGMSHARAPVLPMRTQMEATLIFSGSGNTKGTQSKSSIGVYVCSVHTTMHSPRNQISGRQISREGVSHMVGGRRDGRREEVIT